MLVPRFLAALAVLVAVIAPYGASAEAQGGSGTGGASAAAARGLRGRGESRGVPRGARGARGAPRGAPRGRGDGPKLRGSSSVSSQKVPGVGVPPLKACTSQKLEADLAAKIGDLTVEEKAPEGSCSAADVLMDRLMACASHEARVDVAKELVAKVSEVGVGGLGSLGIVPRLMQALIEVGKLGQQRAGALVAIDELLAVFGSTAEPWTLVLFEKVLDCIGHKNSDVSTNAKAVATKMFALLSDQAVRLVLPAVFPPSCIVHFYFKPDSKPTEAGSVR